MRKETILTLIKWTARIYGSIVLLIPLITLMQALIGDRVLHTDWRSIVLIFGLIIGLSLAYKWELIGGVIALLALLISGFIHPVLIPATLLYMLSGGLKYRSDHN